MEIIEELPYNLRNFISDENLKVKFENFDNILWILIWKNIWVKRKLHRYMKRFVIAHEVWHYYFWHSFAIDIPNFPNNPFEKEADNYAINQLIDEEELKEKVNNWWCLSELEVFFAVPQKYILQKIKELYKEQELNFIF